MKHLRREMIVALLVFLAAASVPWPAYAAGEKVEDPNGRGIVWDIRPRETALLARHRQVTLMLSMEARQATVKAQKSGQMYQVTQVTKPTFNTGNERERISVISVTPLGFLRIKTKRTD